MDVKDIIKAVTKNDLYEYKKRNSAGEFRDVVLYDQMMKDTKTGVVFVSKSKEDLSRGRGFIVTSYESLYDNIDKLTHWTPNTYLGGTYYDFSERIIKGHTKTNLKQINAFGYDIDTKNVDLYALFLQCDECDIPRPNLILETPAGYQVFFVLDTPFYIHKNNNFKAIRVAERVHNNISNAIKDVVPIDVNCNPFGFFRMPRTDNIVYYNDEFINTESFITWSKEYERKERKNQFDVIYGGLASLDLYTSSDWYRTLLNIKDIDSGYYASSRNNTLFTLALANYSDGIPFKDAFDVLDQWNSALKMPLSFNEFNKTLKSAYSGKYKGVKKEYVDALLETWSSGKVSYQSKYRGWYKFAKPRDKRVRSHRWEWIQDIKSFLEEKTKQSAPFFQASYRSIAQNLNIPLSSLKLALKDGQFVIKTIGRGRAAKTYFAVKSMLIRYLINKKKDQGNMTQVQLKDLLPPYRESSKEGTELLPRFVIPKYYDTS